MTEQTFKGGFNFRGTESYFETMLRKAMDERTTPGFRYVEIGIAEGTTLISVAEVLRGSLGDWQAVGIDLCTGSFFNYAQFIARAASFDVVTEYAGSCAYDVEVAEMAPVNGIRILLLKGDSKRAIADNGGINFALIDGCHGAPCVEKDFLSIEQGIARGGIVAFHDAGEADQGIHFQKHCQMNISVREALMELGLFQGPVYTHKLGECARDGWRQVGQVDGDKSPGNLVDNGHGFVFFQKI
jgi:hypothetical protein